MRKFVIERDMPGIGASSDRDFCAAAQNSNQVLAELGTDIQWQQSYVTGDKIYCIYLAKNEDLIRRHAEISGFPANRISEVARVIDPSTAKAEQHEPA